MCEKEFSFMTWVIFLSCLVWHVPRKLSRCCERCCLCAHCKGSDLRLLACWTLLPKTVPEVSVWKVLRILCKICNIFTYLFSLLVQSKMLRWREAVSLPLLNVSGLSGLTVVSSATAPLTQRTCFCHLEPLPSFLWVAGRAPYTTGLHQIRPASERSTTWWVCWAKHSPRTGFLG